MKKLAILTPLLFVFACGGGKDYEETEYDIKISEFLEDKDWETDRQESGLYIYTEDEGSVEKPFPSDYLTLIYEGRLLDGTVFDGTNGAAVTFPFPMSNLIKGWQEGIPNFGKGGKGKLIIPPDLGYGAEETGPIPGNSILVFDIEIVDFSPTPPVQPEPHIDMSVDYSAEIEEYIGAENVSDYIKTEERLYISVENSGSDEKPTVADYVTIFYKGYLMDGTVFDQTDAETRTFPLSGLIPGWKIGIPYLGRGGKGKLVIPPYLAYGEYGQGDIPPNAIIVFDIEVVDFSATQPQ